MRLAGQGGPGKEGTRMGLWGAAQAVAFGLGGLVGTGASDLAHAALGDARLAYMSVFIFQALMFLASALVASHMRKITTADKPTNLPNDILWNKGTTT